MRITDYRESAEPVDRLTRVAEAGLSAAREAAGPGDRIIVLISTDGDVGLAVIGYDGNRAIAADLDTAMEAMRHGT